MAQSAPSLRPILTAVTVAATAVSLFVAAALVTLGARVRDSTVTLISTVESVRLADEAEIALLLYGRSRDPALQHRLANDVQRAMTSAAAYVTTDLERRTLAEATRHVTQLLEGPSGSETLAHEALQRLVDVNVEQAREVERRAESWDRLATVIGVVGGVLLVALAAGIVWWLKMRAFQPVFALAEAVERFGRGDRDARAAPVGPRELRDMIARFNEMADALAAQRGARAAFVAGVAHDLRTPLGVLVLQLELLRPDRPLPPEPVVRHVFEIVRRQIVRLERMLGDMVGTTQLEAGSLDLRVTDNDACELVRGVADLFDGASARHQIALSLPAGPVPLQCDRLRIEQVLTNLVSNAIKYSPGGGTVTLEVRPLEGEVRISVADGGVGISPDEQRRLFEPFRRLGEQTGAIPGAGLGLYVARRIVEAHQGRIEVVSSAGSGATFLVYVPSSFVRAGSTTADPPRLFRNPQSEIRH